jgi:hypothetical protein
MLTEVFETLNLSDKEVSFMHSLFTSSNSDITVGQFSSLLKADGSTQTKKFIPMSKNDYEKLLPMISNLKKGTDETKFKKLIRI